jgi:hypothetical protein
MNFTSSRSGDGEGRMGGILPPSLQPNGKELARGAFGLHLRMFSAVAGNVSKAVILHQCADERSRACFGLAAALPEELAARCECGADCDEIASGDAIGDPDNCRRILLPHETWRASVFR